MSLPPPSEGRHDVVHQGGDFGEDLLHRGGDFFILVVDDPHYSQGILRINAAGRFIPLFRGIGLQFPGGDGKRIVLSHIIFHFPIIFPNYGTVKKFFFIFLVYFTYNTNFLKKTCKKIKTLIH
jgi:hypothetical protein